MNQAKTVVITGATSGIGLATAREFADKGWNVVLAARREDELTMVADELSGRVSVHTHALDTVDEAAVEALATTAREMFGVIDVWVNNAGVYMAGKFEDTPVKDARRLMDTNFFGYVNGSRAALTHFRDQEFGTLINVASVNSVAPQPYVGIYSASKAAVRALDESIRMELIVDELDDTIHVCTVMPAGVDTNLYYHNANYTGKEWRAIEPVYSPELVARRIVGLAEKPKRELIVGGAGRLLALQNRLSLGAYERAVARFTKRDAIGGTDVAPTSGNLYKPVDSLITAAGGWQERRIKGETVDRAATMGIIGLASVAALTAVLLISGKGDKKED